MELKKARKDLTASRKTSAGRENPTSHIHPTAILTQIGDGDIEKSNCLSEVSTFYAERCYNSLCTHDDQCLTAWIRFRCLTALLSIGTRKQPRQSKDCAAPLLFFKCCAFTSWPFDLHACSNNF
jgi:hypothetical protein